MSAGSETDTPPDGGVSFARSRAHRPAVMTAGAAPGVGA